MKLKCCFLLLVLLFGLSGLASDLYSGERGEDPSEALVRKIAKDLRCAVCQNQSVYESNSDLAKDMLVVIRDKVRAGESEVTIRDYFFQRYGDYIYLEPTTAGSNKILWLTPLVGFVLGVLGLWGAIAHWKRSPVVPEGTDAEEGVDPAVKARIQQALDRMEV
ncbi:MAG: cytochrome c-type biogenesis protein CcmH [Magnetococcales bacterium]|nr:cytochrome c-type biogenesis protein CcmH [Magnetococcales bacterium]